MIVVGIHVCAECSAGITLIDITIQQWDLMNIICHACSDRAAGYGGPRGCGLCGAPYSHPVTMVSPVLRLDRLLCTR
jgi:hypothetical protein